MNSAAFNGTRLASHQGGIATLITLLALVIMSLVVLALVRSSDTSALIAGNLAFRRDLTNQGQRVVPIVDTLFESGALSGGPTAVVRQSNLPASNYWATVLPSNNQGIPQVLLNDQLFGNDGFAASNDVSDTTAKVTIRYVIDRLCNTGTTAATATSCIQGYATSSNTGTANITQAGSTFIPAYRLSIRVTGPRNTQAFLQTTLQVN